MSDYLYGLTAELPAGGTSVSLSGTGSKFSAGALAIVVAETIAGAGSVYSAGTFAPSVATSSLAGSGSIYAAGLLTPQVGAAAGAGSEYAAGALAISESAAFPGAGSLFSANPFTPTATFAAVGAGSPSAAGALGIGAGRTLTGYRVYLFYWVIPADNGRVACRRRLDLCCRRACRRGRPNDRSWRNRIHICCRVARSCNHERHTWGWNIIFLWLIRFRTCSSDWGRRVAIFDRLSWSAGVRHVPRLRLALCCRRARAGSFRRPSR